LEKPPLKHKPSTDFFNLTHDVNKVMGPFTTLQLNISSMEMEMLGDNKKVVEGKKEEGVMGDLEWAASGDTDFDAMLGAYWDLSMSPGCRCKSTPPPATATANIQDLGPESSSDEEEAEEGEGVHHAQDVESEKGSDEEDEGYGGEGVVAAESNRPGGVRMAWDDAYHG
jgi:hypothetical protein